MTEKTPKNEKTTKYVKLPSLSRNKNYLILITVQCYKNKNNMIYLITQIDNAYVLKIIEIVFC